MKNKVYVVIDICNKTIVGVYKNAITAQKYIERIDNLYNTGWRLQIQSYTVQE